ncbi:MAG: alpha/beta hydrolase [Bryobacterales bacterium]
MRTVRLLLLAVSTIIPSLAQRGGPPPEVIKLWPDGAPLAQGTADEDTPTLGIYLPERPIGTAVVICPGGGYRNLAMDHEGDQIARWYNSLGIAAFVLKYRLGPKYHHPVELSDVQRAIRIVREGAWRYGVRPDRIGVMGFSAGGHLASTAATHFDAGDANAKDPIDRVSSRPDFAVLCYPVISLTSEYTHKGSRTNLLGENPDAALAESLSNEKQITPETPPTFLWATDEDAAVPAENSVMFYLGLRKAGVPAELHIFERGRHGMGLAWTDRVLGQWPDLLANWLYSRGLLTD